MKKQQDKNENSKVVRLGRSNKTQLSLDDFQHHMADITRQEWTKNDTSSDRPVRIASLDELKTTKQLNLSDGTSSLGEFPKPNT